MNNSIKSNVRYVGVLNRMAYEPHATFARMYWRYMSIYLQLVMFHFTLNSQGGVPGTGVGGGNCFSLSLMISSHIITSKEGQTIRNVEGSVRVSD